MASSFVALTIHVSLTTNVSTGKEESKFTTRVAFSINIATSAKAIRAIVEIEDFTRAVGDIS